MSDNDILREQAHRRSELRRALASEEGSLDGMKANRDFFIFECELVLNLLTELHNNKSLFMQQAFICKTGY